VVIGVNRIFHHEDRRYDIQAEDLGVDLASFEVRVFDQGTVLWRKQVPYRAVLARNLPKSEQDEEIHGLMEKTIHTVEAAIAKGKLS